MKTHIVPGLSPALLLLSAFAAPLCADVLLPGHVGVTHTFEVVELDRAPEGMQFVVHPAYLGGPVKTIQSGEAFTFYKQLSPYLYAISGEMPEFPEAPAWNGPYFEHPELAHSEHPFAMTSSVPAMAATRSIHTIYAFRGIEGNRVLLERLSEVHRDADGEVISGLGVLKHSLLAGLGVTSFLGLAGLLALARRRTSRAAA